jgi:heme oxygenase
MSPFHQALKQKTALNHQLLESDSILAGYLSPSLDVSGYRKIVNQNYIACRHWQAQIDPVFDRLDLPPHWYIDTGVTQLARESTLTDDEAESYGQPEALPLHNLASYLGCAYVFEGSRLGARLILRALKANSRLQGLEFDYFEQLSAANGKSATYWQDWIKSLETMVNSQQLQADDIYTAANQCFGVIGNWFEKNRAVVA